MRSSMHKMPFVSSKIPSKRSSSSSHYNVDTHRTMSAWLYRWTALLVCSCVLLLSSCESEEPLPDMAEENPDSVALAGGSLTQKFGFIENILMQYAPSV